VGHSASTPTQRSALDVPATEVNDQRIALIRKVLEDFGVTLPDPTAGKHGVAVSTAFKGRSKVVAAQPKHFEKFLGFSVVSVGQLGRARIGKTVVRSNMFDFPDAIMGGGHGSRRAATPTAAWLPGRGVAAADGPCPGSGAHWER
jgi:hypothetical protein